MSFFETAFGFTETRDYGATQATLQGMVVKPALLDPDLQQPLVVFKRADGNTIQAGIFETPTLKNLRDRALKELAVEQAKPGYVAPSEITKVGHIVGDAVALHKVPELEGSVFQAASQFNCLEFPSPDNTPEEGITQYMYDRTQGPACAIACPAGTAYRNYLVEMPDGQVGQTKANQIDTMDGVTKALGGDFYTVRNGYIDTTNAKLIALSDKKKAMSETQYDDLKDQLRIGVDWRTQVSAPGVSHIVTQTYNSACSVSYSRATNAELWKDLACLVLEATYEATMWVAVLENIYRARAGKEARQCYMTKVGGGVFGNEPSWVRGAWEMAAAKLNKRSVSLSCQVVHFRALEKEYIE